MAASTTMINPVTTPLMTDPHYHPSSTAPTPPPSASSIDLPPIPALSSYGRHIPLGRSPHDDDEWTTVERLMVNVDVVCLFVVALLVYLYLQ
jgi:hypothetical protein